MLVLSVRLQLLITELATNSFGMVISVFSTVLILVDLHVTSITLPLISLIETYSSGLNGLSILTNTPDKILLRLACIANPIIAAKMPEVARILVNSNSNTPDSTNKVGTRKSKTSTESDIISGIFKCELRRSSFKY